MAYRIRLMEPKDVPAVQKLHEEQNKRDGTNYPLTQVFDPESWMQRSQVPLAVVILDGDEIKQAAIFETTVEMMLAGCDAKSTATLRREIGQMFFLLHERGFGGVHCLVPKQVVIPVERPLERVGFARDDFKLAHFFKDLTEAPDEP